MTDTWALKDVSFTIQRGQLAVIVGFNGSVSYLSRRF